MRSLRSVFVCVTIAAACALPACGATDADAEDSATVESPLEAKTCPPTGPVTCDVRPLNGPRELSLLGKTGQGARYHVRNCDPNSPTFNPDKIYFFIPGTGTTPSDYRYITYCTSQATGVCAIAVPYDTTRNPPNCCMVDPDTFLYDRACVENLHTAKLYGEPSSYRCVIDDPGPYFVPPSATIEGRMVSAIRTLGLEASFLEKEGGERVLDRSKIILGGHSQGAKHAAADAFIGGAAAWKKKIPGQPLLGVASNASGFNKLPELEDGFLYESFHDQPPATPITRFRALSHIANNHNGRKQFLDAMKVPPGNVHVTHDNSAQCQKLPNGAHNCTAYDDDVEIGPNGTPTFLNEWVWLACGDGQ